MKLNVLEIHLLAGVARIFRGLLVLVVQLHPVRISATSEKRNHRDFSSNVTI